MTTTQPADPRNQWRVIDTIRALRTENEALRTAALCLLEHPRSSRAALAMYEALGTDPLREQLRRNAR